MSFLIYNFTLRLQNEVDAARTLDVTLSASSVYYNGVDANLIKQANGKFKVRPRGRKCNRQIFSHLFAKNG